MVGSGTYVHTCTYACVDRPYTRFMHDSCMLGTINIHSVSPGRINLAYKYP